MVCGPTPGDLSDDEFLEVRARHLATAYEIENDQCAADLRQQRTALENFADHEDVVLWFEHDLFCQVHLVYLLNWFAHHDLGRTTLSLICIDQFPGVNDFRGLGQLNESQLKSLFPQRRAVTAAQLQLGQKAWVAYSSSTPALLQDLISAKTDALRFLKPAFTKHLERFPSVRNGLGRIENVLLELIAEGDKDFKSLFASFQRREPLYGFGDAQIFHHLQRLASATHPLLTMNNPQVRLADSSRIAETSFEITEQGRRTLIGEEDFVRLNGIDFWLGGVHLKNQTPGWRWIEATQSLECGD